MSIRFEFELSWKSTLNMSGMVMSTLKLTYSSVCEELFGHLLLELVYGKINSYLQPD